MLRLFDIHFILALRAWILHEDHVITAGRSNLFDLTRGDPRMARAFDAMAAAYYGLALAVGIPPTPDLLLRLGSVGTFIHAVVCQIKTSWMAFNRGVCRRHPDLPSLVPLTADERKLQSPYELLVFRRLRNLSGVTVTKIHPVLGATRYCADFLLTGATERSLYLEVTSFADDPAFDNAFQLARRCRLATKLIVYAQLELELPVITGIDDLAPRRLEAKMAEILDRLALPVPPPRPSGWFEGEAGGGLA